ncbi:DUF418 domain-containing protein [Actinoalloteichus hymeniacidonis]|uniref:DUF418 family protein n=1 Tax=Actinoalloteichus hymeniacidonis TaxID=340345 RepID=A0AAC9HTW7_9PSEU|nr:DUF418 domain-containing protein [Actinoalloteichus hymeniacidonis]AOS65527.1 putative DUF418 family protein [Actinoalloteichus hymeniacidonis]MBB5906385.1 putative membrane protein [Actinoalloteichus hymeniacidonis]
MALAGNGEEVAAAPGVDPHRTRLLGVDLARCLAVLGMFVAHVGPHPREGGSGAALWIFHGFPSALFALLAGVSLALLTGGSTPVGGADARTARQRILLRALLLFPLGLILAALGTNVLIILCYYAIYFVLALPLLWLRPLWLGLVTVVTAVGGPVLSFFIRGAVSPTSRPYEYGTFGGADGDGLLALFLTGTYPALTWLPFVFAGVVLGRLDLRRLSITLWVGLTGAVVVAVGYGGSWLASTTFGARDRLYELLAGGSPGLLGPDPQLAPQAAEALDEMIRWGMLGTVPTDDPAWLSIAAPHSGTPFDVVGSTGVALLVVAVCLLLTRSGLLARLLSPLTAAGSMPLTIYSGHLLVLAMIGPIPDELEWPILLGLMAVTVVCAFVWRRFLGRGPLEMVLHSFTTRVAPGRTDAHTP